MWTGRLIFLNSRVPRSVNVPCNVTTPFSSTVGVTSIKEIRKKLGQLGVSMKPE